MVMVFNEWKLGGGGFGVNVSDCGRGDGRGVEGCNLFWDNCIIKRFSACWLHSALLRLECLLYFSLHGGDCAVMDGCHSQEYMFLPEFKCCMNGLTHISIGNKFILGQKHEFCIRYSCSFY